MAENQEEFLERCNVESQGFTNVESQGFTMDGSVDLKGRPVLKSKTGRWKACSFLVCYELFERMAFFGIAANLVNYLTTKLHEGTVYSSTTVANWSGTVFITPVIGAYIADTFWGRYWTFAVFSCIYVLGMILLTVDVSVPSLQPPKCQLNSNSCQKASEHQIGIFFVALYVIALGAGGTKPNISTIGADQFDEFDPKEKLQKASFFNWWIFFVFFGMLFAESFLIYVQEMVGFGVGYGILTTGLFLSLVVFFLGTPFYRHKVQKGNPFNRMAQVLVASARKWRVKLPSDPNQLYEVDVKEYIAEGRFPIKHTPNIRFLDKAATKDASISPWKLCPVTQVEETKLMIRMLPVWVTMFVPSSVFAHASTLFVRQATTLNRHMGPHFQIPAGSLSTFSALAILVSLVLYDRVLIRIARKFTGNPRGITMLQRLGIGMALHGLTMAVASITDMKRISFVKQHGLQGSTEPAPLTVFILLPQFLLAGIAEAFFEAGRLEFFYDQAPESMQSIGTGLYVTTAGIGSFLTSFLLNASSTISGRKGHTRWILNNLNASRIYNYYAMVAVLSVLNFILFLVICRFYSYKRETNEAFGSHSHGHGHARQVTTEECQLLPLGPKRPANEMETNEMEMVKYP